LPCARDAAKRKIAARLVVAIGEDAGTIEDVNEPYLIMQGYLKRTPQGRVAMPLADKKLGITAPKREGELFG
jgi:Holliday junction DNA helicase RuvB